MFAATVASLVVVGLVISIAAAAAPSFHVVQVESGGAATGHVGSP